VYFFFGGGGTLQAQDLEFFVSLFDFAGKFAAASCPFAVCFSNRCGVFFLSFMETHCMLFAL